MAQNNQNVANNAANAAIAEKKEEAVMNNTATEVTNAPATQEQQAQVPATAPEQTPAEKPKFWDGPVGSKIKKVGKWVAAGAAIVGGLFIAEKVGEGLGFDKATDAYNKASENNSSGDDPDDDDDDDDNIIDDDGGYTEVE